MFAYSALESALAAMHDADAEAQRTTFRARMKHFQRLGIPLGLRPGRGRKISYSFEQAYQFAICLELAEFGIDPTLIVEVVTTEWYKFSKTLSDHDDEVNERLLAFSPAMMSSNWARSGKDLGVKGLLLLSDVAASTVVDGLMHKRFKRLSLINVTSLIDELRWEIDPDHRKSVAELKLAIEGDSDGLHPKTRSRKR